MDEWISESKGIIEVFGLSALAVGICTAIFSVEFGQSRAAHARKKSLALLDLDKLDPAIVALRRIQADFAFQPTPATAGPDLGLLAVAENQIGVLSGEWLQTGDSATIRLREKAASCIRDLRGRIGNHRAVGINPPMDEAGAQRMKADSIREILGAIEGAALPATTHLQRRLCDIATPYPMFMFRRMLARMRRQKS